MRFNHKVLTTFLIITCLLILSINTVDAKKTVPTTNLTTFNGYASAAEDINNNGQITGVYYKDTPTLSTKAFVLTDGTKTELPDLADSYATHTMAINDDGEIAGYTLTPEGDTPRYLPHAVMWTDTDTIVTLEPATGVVASQTRDINNLGQNVGFTMQVYPPDETIGRYAYYTAPENAFLWTQDDGITILDIPLTGSEIASAATGINNNGQIVGYTLVANNLGVPISHRAYIYNIEDETTEFINPPKGGKVTVATNINDAGQVIGFWISEKDNIQHGFVWKAKTGMKEIKPLQGGENVVPLEINNLGQVVGVCTKRGEPNNPPAFERGFMWDSKRTELPPLPTDQTSTARGINDLGQVVGTSTAYEPKYDSDGNLIGYYTSVTAVMWEP